jgi:hypothetical protein
MPNPTPRVPSELVERLDEAIDDLRGATCPCTHSIQDRRAYDDAWQALAQVQEVLTTALPEDDEAVERVKRAIHDKDLELRHSPVPGDFYSQLARAAIHAYKHPGEDGSGG